MDKSQISHLDEVNVKFFIDRTFFMKLCMEANVEASALIDYALKETSRKLEIHIEKMKIREMFFFGSHRIDDAVDMAFRNKLAKIPKTVNSFVPMFDMILWNEKIGHGLGESGVDNAFLAETLYRVKGPIKADVSIIITGDVDLVILPNYIGNLTVPVLIRFNLPKISRFTSSDLAQNFTYVINTFEDLTRFKYAFDNTIKSGKIITLQSNTGFITSPNRLCFNTKADDNGVAIETPNFYFYKENCLAEIGDKPLTEYFGRGDEVYFQLKYLFNVKTQSYHFCAVNVTADRNKIAKL